MTGWARQAPGATEGRAEPEEAWEAPRALKTQDGAISPGSWGLWELDEARKEPPSPEGTSQPLWLQPGRPTLDFRPQTARCLLCARGTGFTVVCWSGRRNPGY